MSKIRLFKLPALAVGLLLAFTALSLVRAQQGDDNEKKKEEPPEKAGPPPAEIAGKVKAIFQATCYNCHGGPGGTGDGIKIMEVSTWKNRKIKPGSPEGSKLIKTLTRSDDRTMPPPGKGRKLSPEEMDWVRKWIAAGAPDFPADAPKPPETDKDPSFKNIAGVNYVMKQILKHVRGVPEEDLTFVRYFSINHILVAGAAKEELVTYRDAFAKALNHLSWESELVKPESIDAPYDTVYAVDIRRLGWQTAPYKTLTSTGKGKGKAVRGQNNELNLFDLMLLEYPYAAFYRNSPTYERLVKEYIMPAYLVRPIPYVRMDWFCSVVTQPPLYEDMLMLPYNVKDLEEYIGVDPQANIRNYRAMRAGMTVSGVSRNNRVVERHPMTKGTGAYWKSYDFKSSKGEENMFKDPIRFRESGGEMIFNLPNGLQAYYVADAAGERIEFAPTDIVTDKHASDKTVRNGLACIRCHDQGMKGFTDDVRPALDMLPDSPRLAFDTVSAIRLYPGQKKISEYLKRDTKRFMDALHQTLGKEQGEEEPLVPVSHRFLDKEMGLATAAGELGLNDHRELVSVFKQPGFSTLGLLPLSAGGVIRRDAWEDYYDSVIRGLGLGTPIVPLDGLNRLDYPAGRSEVDVKLGTTGGKGNVFTANDRMVITVANKSPRAVYIELIGTSTQGRKVILTNPSLMVKAGETYKFPPDGTGLKITPKKGKEQITLLASYNEFPAGYVLRGPSKGRYVTDRVYHPFYSVSVRGNRAQLHNDAATMVKRTIEIETK